jgi:hypothetical protein
MRLNAIAADHLNAFKVDKLHSSNLSAMVSPSVKFSNLDNYDLNDKELFLSIDNVAHSIIEKRPVHFDP